MIKSFLYKKRCFLWSPMLSNVGTINAIHGIANSIKKYSDSEVYIFNVLGEFNYIKTDKFILINFIGSYLNLPKTGLLSKLLIIFFSLISLPYLIYCVFKFKPDIIITGLVGFIPSSLKYFFPKIILINSVQGLPKFNLIRKFLWVFFYKKSDFLITMTNQTKEEINRVINISLDKILKIPNPVINRTIKNKSLENLDNIYSEIFKKKVFCTIGRLTFQKNYIGLINSFYNFSKTNNFQFNLIIIGDGEQKNKIKNIIRLKKIPNIFILGFQKNPYKFLAKSDYYISSSLWEEPGHTLIEAGYLNVPIISSNCPNGPNELIVNGYNGIKYDLNSEKDFQIKIHEMIKLSEEDRHKLCKNMKKEVREYTEFRFYKNLQNLLNH